MPGIATPTTWPEQLRAALAADPKRTGVLAVLALVLLILCFRAMRSGPATATAALLPSPASLNVPTPSGMSAERNGSSNALIEWLAQPKRPATRNLFAMRLDAYPMDARGPMQPGESISSSESAKSNPSQADQNGVQESLAKQAAKLKLQSTFLGPTPMALVSGQLVREGDFIGQFQIVKIEPRRVVIQQDGTTLSISMD